MLALALAPILAPVLAPTMILATIVVKVLKKPERRSLSLISEEEELVLVDYWVWKGRQMNNLNKKV